MAAVEFHGTDAEKYALLAALDHNCVCVYDEASGAVTARCAAHKLLEDQKTLNGLLFDRRIAERLLEEEYHR